MVQRVKKEKEGNNIKECICGNHNYHSMECRGHNRHIYLLEVQRINRKEKRAKHICIYSACNKKVKPEIIYHQYCNKHRKMARKQQRVKKK